MNVDERNQAYLEAVGRAQVQDLRDHLTSFCPECERDVSDMSEEEMDQHVILGKAVVIIACEGYWMIDPSLVGLPKGQWSDWREDGLEELEET